MENRSLLTHEMRETRSPFLAAVQAERQREFATSRRWRAFGVAFLVIGMIVNLGMIAGFLARG